MKLMLSLVTLMTLLSACASRNEVRVESTIGDAIVTAWLTDAKPATNEEGTIVYGHLEIRSKNPIASAKLDCIGLATPTAHSQRIYIDSVASVLTDKFPARDGVVIAKVYWLIPKLQSNKLDLAQIRLSIKNDTRCVKYSEEINNGNRS